MVAVLLGHQDALNIARVAQRLGALAASETTKSEIIGNREESCDGARRTLCAEGL